MFWPIKRKSTALPAAFIAMISVACGGGVFEKRTPSNDQPNLCDLGKEGYQNVDGQCKATVAPKVKDFTKVWEKVEGKQEEVPVIKVNFERQVTLVDEASSFAELKLNSEEGTNVAESSFRLTGNQLKLAKNQMTLKIEIVTGLTGQYTMLLPDVEDQWGNRTDGVTIDLGVLDTEKPFILKDSFETISCDDEEKICKYRLRFTEKVNFFGAVLKAIVPAEEAENEENEPIAIATSSNNVEKIEFSLQYDVLHKNYKLIILKGTDSVGNPFQEGDIFLIPSKKEES